MSILICDKPYGIRHLLYKGGKGQTNTHFRKQMDSLLDYNYDFFTIDPDTKRVVCV